jgi:DNA-binding NtrC family response regulator
MTGPWLPVAEPPLPANDERAEGGEREAGAGEAGALSVNLETLEKWAIPEALKRTGGNKTQAAELLGITRETLANKLKRFGLAGKEES